jgi:aspartate 1-decarboxylase
VQRIMLKAKIHRARVTDANLDYEGSITIDEALMEAADIYPFEQVQVYNVTNGNRFETYALKGERNSGVICINGAAAHQASKDDLIIIANYSLLEVGEDPHHPTLIYVDEANRIIKTSGPGGC